MEHRNKRSYEKLKEAALASLVIAGLYLLFHFLGITCPIKYMTGISCPGCGMTRAVLSAATFHFQKAFSYHPLWVLMPVWALVLYEKERIPVMAFRVFSVITVLLFFIIYVLRMMDPGDTVVVFAPENGCWYRMLRSGMKFIK